MTNEFFKLNGVWCWILFEVKNQKGIVAIQSLKTGETTRIKRTQIKNITNKYPLE